MVEVGQLRDRNDFTENNDRANQGLAKGQALYGGTLSYAAL
jgi:hypothetical protein